MKTATYLMVRPIGPNRFAATVGKPSDVLGREFIDKMFDSKQEALDFLGEYVDEDGEPLEVMD